MNQVSVVLVTNVGQGFGRSIALSFGKLGYDVICADRDVDLASKTAAEIEELGGQAIPIQADMTAQIDVKNAFEKVFEIFGTLSGVVHVAALESQTPFKELSESEFAELYQENVKSTFLTLKVTALMLEQDLLKKAWLVIVSPPKSATEPHMISVRGAITRMAASFETRHEPLRVNVVVPSRPASDASHDAPLLRAVHYLGSPESIGMSGHRMYVKLPPPPKVVESLLPEVRAALDDKVRQDDLEASHFDDDVAVDPLEDALHDDPYEDPIKQEQDFMDVP